MDSMERQFPTLNPHMAANLRTQFSGKETEAQRGAFPSPSEVMSVMGRQDADLSHLYKTITKILFFPLKKIEENVFGLGILIHILCTVVWPLKMVNGMVQTS